MSGPLACKDKPLTAAMLPKARSLVVNPPEGIPGVARVPKGFSADAVVAGPPEAAIGRPAETGSVGPSAGGAVAAAGAAPSGSAGKVLIIGVAAGAVGVGAALLASGDDAVTLTGQWQGTGSDGWYGTQTGPGQPTCTTADDLFLDLNQTGTSVTGSAVFVQRTVSCSDGFTIPPGAGASRTFSVTGIVNGGNVSLSLSRTTPGGSSTSQVSGTASGSRMSGTFTATFPGTTATGTWAVVRP
jgi:hypothetical protein